MKKYLKNKSYKKFLVYLSSGSLAKVVPFLILTLTTTVLTTEDFGRISNFSLIVELSTSLILVRMVPFFETDYYKNDTKQNTHVITNVVFIMIIAFVALLLLALIFAGYLQKVTGLGVFWIILGVCSGLFGAFASLRTSILRLTDQAKKFATFQLLNVFLLALLTLFLVFIFKLHWIGRILSIVVTSLVLFSITIRFLYKNHDFPDKVAKSKILEILRFSLPLIPFAISPFLKQGLDKIYITNLISMSANGVYSLALSFSSIFDMIVASLFAVYTPMVYKNLSKSENLVNSKRNLVKQAYKLIGSLIAIEIAGFFAIMFFVKLFLSVDYLDSLIYLPYLLLHVLLRSMYLLLSTYILYSKKTKEFGLSALVFALMHTTFSYFLISKIGILGALYALLFTDVIRLIYTYYLSNKHNPMPWWDARSIFKGSSAIKN